MCGVRVCVCVWGGGGGGGMCICVVCVCLCVVHSYQLSLFDSETHYFNPFLTVSQATSFFSL